jgi:hypothetical protein
MVYNQEAVPPSDGDRTASRDTRQLAEDPPKLVGDSGGNADREGMRVTAQEKSPGGTPNFPE